MIQYPQDLGAYVAKLEGEIRAHTAALEESRAAHRSAIDAHTALVRNLQDVSLMHSQLAKSHADLAEQLSRSESARVEATDALRAEVSRRLAAESHIRDVESDRRHLVDQATQLAATAQDSRAKHEALAGAKWVRAGRAMGFIRA